VSRGFLHGAQRRHHVAGRRRQLITFIDQTVLIIFIEQLRMFIERSLSLFDE
jgi:hypothetical protein